MCADFVAGAALGEPRGAYFVAGTALGEPRSADFVAGAAHGEPRSEAQISWLGKPRSANFVAGAVLCAQMLTLSLSPPRFSKKGAWQNPLLQSSGSVFWLILSWQLLDLSMPVGTLPKQVNKGEFSAQQGTTVAINSMHFALVKCTRSGGQPLIGVLLELQADCPIQRLFQMLTPLIPVSCVRRCQRNSSRIFWPHRSEDSLQSGTAYPGRCQQLPS